MVKPLINQPPQPEKKPNGRVTLIRRYELITPLFGGGVRANEVDTANPIRGTAVRGQLRFWWRATRGTRFGADLKSLKSKEDEIWGSTEQGARISITIVESNPGSIYRVNPNNTMNVGDPRSPLGYVAFPLNPGGETVYEGASFTLRIDLPKTYRPELKAALWAWETFGGIGARTRRGFGALHCEDVQLTIDDKAIKADNWIWNYSSQAAADELLARVHEFVNSGAPHTGISSISRAKEHTRITPAQRNVYDAWEGLIKSLKTFRQSRSNVVIKGQTRPFGRSHWPEPDTIRDLTNQRLGKHGNRIYDNPPIHKFPRAAFGLPIIFEFKDDNDHNPLDKKADPRKTELSGARYERRASRLILKPIKCTDGNFVGLATILNGQSIPPGGLGLKNAVKDLHPQPNQPAPDSERLDPNTEAPRIQQRMGGIYNGDIDILQAFIDQLPST